MAPLTDEQEQALREALTALHQGQQAYTAMGRFLKILQRKGLLDSGDVAEVLAVMEQGHDQLSRALSVLFAVQKPPSN